MPDKEINELVDITETDNWQEADMQTLRDYLGSDRNFTVADDDGYYVFNDEEEHLKIKVKPICDCNFEAIFNASEPMEGALEVVGDAIIATFQFWYLNNDSEMDKIWVEHYESKEKKCLSI